MDTIQPDQLEKWHTSKIVTSNLTCLIFHEFSGRNVILHGKKKHHTHLISMLPKFFLAENWTSSRPADQWINWKRLWSTKIWLRRWLNEINEKLWNWDKYVRYTDIHDKMYVYIKYMCIYIYMVKGACHTYHKYHVPINLLEAIFTIYKGWMTWLFFMRIFDGNVEAQSPRPLKKCGKVAPLPSNSFPSDSFHKT